MINYDELPHHSILCIDMKSFYASCAAIMRGLDPMECYLAVVGNLQQKGSVVLAASPKLKKDFGIKTGTRLFEIPKDNRILIVEAQMASYLKTSTEIVKLFNQYAPKEDIHVYSVDESFIKVDGLRRLFGDPHTIAKKIKADIKTKFGLPCTIGIGPNMLMAKLALDLESKKAESGIAEWTYEDVQKKLWPVRPLSKMWGIGSRLEKTLNKMGIFSVGQLARHDLSLLEKKFGVMGNQLYHHAWGVDLSDLGAPILQGQISFGKSQILMRDYKKEHEIKTVILEMCEEVARRARKSRKAGRTISLGIGYSESEYGGGFYRSHTIDEPTNITMVIYKECLKLFRQYYTGKSVRQISISLSRVTDDTNLQLSLFEPWKDKQRDLAYVVDKIRDRFGSAAILRAVSYTEAGTALKRSKLVGGHKA
ncbi:UV damage repair protein UvrX [Heyndrickxia ginsengihumi]|uniref:UV damage repair protein UvrX n=1 Tax=Heyndrickxia ginsengihumi TaxID=363870 RepID=A0A0A6VDQ4_9BACI|nr:UV damage repair protein UvrX [Heyndrickxia ginsengihumi]KHD86385.1 UV damage repair protein UvrX [Heyndrickxia ginsengihumi]